MNVRFPFEIDHLGRVASTAEHGERVVELIEQVLFTAPGERVNRPDFGCGTLLLVFQSGNDTIAAAVSSLVHAQLQRWLGDLIRVQGVEAAVVESELVVNVEYSLLLTGAKELAEFRRPA